MSRWTIFQPYSDIKSRIEVIVQSRWTNFQPYINSEKVAFCNIAAIYWRESNVWTLVYFELSGLTPTTIAPRSYHWHHWCWHPQWYHIHIKCKIVPLNTRSYWLTQLATLFIRSGYYLSPLTQAYNKGRRRLSSKKRLLRYWTGQAAPDKHVQKSRSVNDNSDINPSGVQYDEKCEW